MADEEVGVRLSLKDRQRFSRELREADQDVDRLGRSAERAGRRADGAGRGIGRFSGAIKSGLVGAAKVGVTAVAGLAVGIGALTIKTVQLATDAGETASKFNTVFAGMTDQVGGFVEQMNTDYGIPTKDLQDAASTFGVFGKAAGVAQDDLAKFSTDIVAAGTDMASFYNAPVDEVFLALRSGLSGESEPLRKFGIFLSDASLNAFALEQGIKKTTKEMSDAEKVQLRQQFILANMGDAHGDLARTSDSLANKQKALKGRLTEAGTAIGTALLPYVTELVTKLDEHLQPAVKWLQDNAGGFVDGMIDGLGGIVDIYKGGGISGLVDHLDDAVGAGGLVSDTFEAVQSIMEDLWTIFSTAVLPVWKDLNEAIPRGIRPLEIIASVLDKVADHASLLAPLVAALTAGWLAHKAIVLVTTGVTKAAAAAQWLLNVALSANPIGLVVIALAALVAGLVYAWNHSETFREVVTGAFNTVKGAAETVFNWISDNWPTILAVLTGPFGLAVLAITRNWDSIKSGAIGAVNGIIKAWNSLDIEVGPYNIPDWVPFVGGKTFHIADVFPDVGLIGGGGGGGGGRRIGGVPVAHEGANITGRGSVVIKPDEELVNLPSGASVVPLPPSERLDLASVAAAAAGGGPDRIVLEVDGKVLAEVTKDKWRDEAARR